MEDIEHAEIELSYRLIAMGEELKRAGRLLRIAPFVSVEQILAQLRDSLDQVLDVGKLINCGEAEEACQQARAIETPIDYTSL